MTFIISFIAVVLFSAIFSLFITDFVTLIIRIWNTDTNKEKKQ